MASLCEQKSIQGSCSSFISPINTDAYYLSDVHVQCKFQSFRDKYISRFFFKYPSALEDEKRSKLKQDCNNKSLVFIQDEDGDFDINMQMDTASQQEMCSKSSEHDKSDYEVITVEHLMQTSLDDVGYQVWLGGLLLCDYLIHRQTNIAEKIVLDLGAGTGLTSIVAALVSKKVICTDYCPKIIELAQKNWIRNQNLLPGSIQIDKMKFMILDWKNNTLSLDENTSDYDVDRQQLLSVDSILVSEGVYDDELTDACFRTIYYLLCKPPEKEVIMAVERSTLSVSKGKRNSDIIRHDHKASGGDLTKSIEYTYRVAFQSGIRLIFSTVSHDVCSPAYEHFKENLNELSSIDQGDVRFKVIEIPSHNLPQYFEYTRTKELELWSISSMFTKESHEILDVT